MGLLGYGSLTLTDLTDALPASLNLSSSLNSNIQVKEGTVYAPDFTKGGAIITPSLFLGGDEVPSSKYAGKIVYTINGEDKAPNVSDEKGVFVCYKIDKNLEANCSVSARIENFVSDENIKYTSIYSLNPVNLILLEKNAGYSAFIESAREYFEDENTEPIILIARLYSGINELEENVFYKWTDSDGTDLGTSKTITVSRDQISSMETFICEITNSYGTKFRVSKNIYDMVDAYQGAIIANGSTILTPQNTKITLTSQIWHQANVVNGTDSQVNNFTYNWYCLNENGQFTNEASKTERKFVIDLSLMTEEGELIFPKTNFIVYCETKIGNKAVVVSSLAIQYSPVNYSVSVNPVAFFIPSTSNGSYKGSTSITKEITFQLLDDNKQPLSYNTSDVAPHISDFSPFTSMSVSSNNVWNFTISLTYDPVLDATNSFKEMDDKIFSISYTYLGIPFEANFQCIKSIQGEDGGIGASGYTISLSNEFWMLAGGEVSATPGQTTETDILVLEGAENLMIVKLKIGEEEFDDTGKLTIGKIQVEKEGTENKRLKFTSLQNLMEGGSFPIYVTFKSLEDKEITMVKIFRYEINYKGDAYSLLCEPSSLVYTPASKSFNSNSIALSPVCYIGGVGDATVMSDYLITAQVDSGVEIPLSSLTYTTFDKTNNSIIFRLYRSQTVDRAKMVDIVTVPIIISQEGIIVGGENLIPWTKKMPFENNKWEEKGSISRRESSGFTILDFSGTSETTSNYCYTPEFPAQEDFFGRQMTFSAEVYCTDWKNLADNQDFSFVLGLAEDELKTYTIGTIQATAFTDGMASDGLDAPIDGKWFKVYSTFTYPTAFESIPTGNLCISFGTIPRAPVRIKKLKLEQGNVPTAWSARYGDTTLEDVAGTNLCQDASLRLQVKASDPFIVLTQLLEENKQYTLSIMNTSIEGTSSDMNEFLCQIIKINDDGTNTAVQSYKLNNNSVQTQIQTFTTPSEEATYGVLVYAQDSDEVGNDSTILTLSYVKIEEGAVATSFVVTEDYLMNIYNTLKESNDATNQQITIISADGQEIRAQLDGTQDSIRELQENYANSSTTLNDLQTQLTMVNNNLAPILDENGYLQQIQKKITFSTDDSDPSPFIKIETKAGNKAFATKITDDQIGFYQNNSDEAIAYLSSNTLMVNYAKFNKSFNIGDLQVSITESGVGFNW